MNEDEMKEKFKKIENKAKEDLEIDDTKLKRESQDHPNIYHRYLTWFRNEQRKLRKAERVKQEIYNKLYNKYSGKGSNKRYKSKTAIEAKLKKDQQWKKAKRIYDEQKTLCEYLEGILYAFKSRGFAIKNIIDLEKQENEALYE